MSDFNGEEEEEEFSLNPDEIVQIIDLNDVPPQGPGEGSDDDDDGQGQEDEDGEDEMDTSEAAAQPSQDDSALSFLGHKDSSVICTRLSPVDSRIAITGGQDDQAFVWNTQDGSVYFCCTGHTDTVASVGFSHDGNMVATADMKGLVKVWKVDTGVEIWSFEVSEIEWVMWHHAAPVLLAATKEGQLWMWKIPSGDCKTMTGLGPSALCGKILPDGKHVCVGYEDGVVKIWDLKSVTAIHTVSGHDAHKESVFCMDTNQGNLILTGSGDMTAKVINTATGKVLSTLVCDRADDEDDDSVEAVAFSKTHDYAVTGTLSGKLQIWDLPTKSLRHRCEHPYGIVKISWSATSSMFYTACLDGSIRQFDSRSGELIRTWQGHTAAVLDLDISPDENILVTASDDSTAKVFSLQSLQR